LGRSLQQFASMLRHRSLAMLFSDRLGRVEPVRARRCGGCGIKCHDVIPFQVVVDEAEV
jgi:hypothetical protein